jgi:hypothetical protein
LQNSIIKPSKFKLAHIFAFYVSWNYFYLSSIWGEI